MTTEDSPSIAVVVADNRETVLRAVSGTLEKAGFTILAASSGAAAIKYCRESKQPVNLAIIDAETPGLNLADLVRQLEALSPNMRTLFLTVEGQEELLHSVSGSGRVRGMLRKPFRRAHLLGQVLEMMDRPLVLTA
jgi:two-component system cell cycle sensor histidine kinase/response regulator CckA